jgi:hypothetical protein
MRRRDHFNRELRAGRSLIEAGRLILPTLRRLTPVKAHLPEAHCSPSTEQTSHLSSCAGRKKPAGFSCFFLESALTFFSIELNGFIPGWRIADLDDLRDRILESVARKSESAYFSLAMGAHWLYNKKPIDRRLRAGALSGRPKVRLATTLLPALAGHLLKGNVLHQNGGHGDGR